MAHSSNRGFAAMDESKQKKIASEGGKASHGGGRKQPSSKASGSAGLSEATLRDSENSQHSR